jgi:hypothetical protein
MSGPIAALISLASVQAAITMAGLLLLPAIPLINRANRLHVEDESGGVLEIQSAD